MAYGELVLPPIPKNKKQKHIPWNKGKTWKELGFGEKHLKAVQKNLLVAREASSKARKGKPAVNSKPVVVIDPESNLIIGYFFSSKECERQMNIPNRLIRRVCNGERKTTYGLIFKFEKDL